MHVYGVGQGGVQGVQKIMSGDVIGGMLDLVDAGVNARRLHQWSCFTGEMLIDVAAGKERADQIREGDLLWARDENDPHAELKLQAVEEVFVRVSPVVNLHVAGQIIRTTAEHPFYVRERGWWPAAELQAGDLIGTRDGGWVAVEGVADSGEVATVYNFRVAEYHTYFVSSVIDGLAVWAHNAQQKYIPGSNPAVDKSIVRHQQKVEKQRIALESQSQPRPQAPVATERGRRGEIVRRFDSKAAVKKAKKDGIKFDPEKGSGIPTTTTHVDAVYPDRIKEALGAKNADYYMNIDISGKPVIRRQTGSGRNEIVIAADVHPDDIVKSGRVRRS